MVQPITEHHTVIRPTMKGVDTSSGKLTTIVMQQTGFNGDPNPDPEPPREDVTVVTATKWKDGNTYKQGETVYFTTAVYTGGDPEKTTTRWRLQKRDGPDGSWVNYSWTNYDNTANECNITCPAGQMRIHCQARDNSVDPVQQVNSFSPVQAVEPLPPLAVSDPVATGEPVVGYTLTCSEPVVTGGSGTLQFDYFWVDETNAIVWEATYMSNTTKVVAYDIGKTMKCLVTVTDMVTNENVTVASNQLGPINRPYLPDFDCWVDGELHDDPSADVGVPISGSVVLEVRRQPTATPPVDMTYLWRIRNGTGRLSGDETSTGIIYLAPDSAPAGAHVTCTVESQDANDNAIAAEVTILVAE